MAVKFSNNASATLATSINTSVTTIQVAAGQGAQFPTLGAGDYHFATLVDSSNNIEIVKVTARASDTLTVVRAQESTTPRAYVAGDKIECRVTAAGLTAIYTDAKNYADASGSTLTTSLNNHLTDTTDAHAASAIGFSATGGISSTNVQAAITELDTEKASKTTTISGSSGISTSGDLGSGVVISPTAGYNGHGARTVSTSAPSGGNDGDIWYQVA